LRPGSKTRPQGIRADLGRPLPAGSQSRHVDPLIVKDPTQSHRLFLVGLVIEYPSSGALRYSIAAA